MVGSIFVARILEQRRYRPAGPGFERHIRHREMNLLVGVDGEHHLRTRILFLVVIDAVICEAIALIFPVALSTTNTIKFQEISTPSMWLYKDGY